MEEEWAVVVIQEELRLLHYRPNTIHNWLYLYTAIYLETAMKQVFTGNNVRDLSLIKAMGDGRGSQGGVEGYDY